jgi:predicted transposase YbfD/YdcC
MELPNLKDSFFEAFSLIEDPRSANSAHSIETVLFCLLIGVICGADGFVRAEQIADLKKDFIRRYVPLGKKVPTHDTMARLLARIDPDQFVASFARFMRRLTGYSERDILNFDGQTLRGVTGTAAQHRSRSKAAKDQEHIVTAFSTMRCIVLAQIKTLAGVNEVSAAQELLTILDVKGAIITADAMHACAKTFEMIKERGADYVVTLKQNTPLLCDAAELAFRQNEPIVVETKERRGKVTEKRRYEIVPSGDLSGVGHGTVGAFIRVTRENVSHSGRPRKTDEPTMYVASLSPGDVDAIVDSIRKRWEIENKLHWVLDVTFRQDRSRIRVMNAAQNFTRVRHIVFNALSLARDPKRKSFDAKRTRASMDEKFLARALRLRAA